MHTHRCDGVRVLSGGTARLLSRRRRGAATDVLLARRSVIGRVGWMMRVARDVLRVGLAFVTVGCAVPIFGGGLALGFIAARIQRSRRRTPVASGGPRVEELPQRAVISMFSSRSFR